MNKTFGAMVFGGITMLAGWAVQAGAQTAGQISDSDKSFIADASQGDLTETKLSQLALDKSSNADVKTYAQKMITDHAMLELKMKPFAEKAGVAPATELTAEHQAVYDKLNGLSGADFDKAYVEAMDKDHHEDLTKFKTEASTTKDPDLKKTVAQGTKVVAMHTKMADGMSRKMGQTPATS